MLSTIASQVHIIIRSCPKRSSPYHTYFCHVKLICSSSTVDAELTNYHFEVSPDALESSLDRFAQFFIGPLFTASGTQRELRAIENEHVASLNVRFCALRSEREGHPCVRVMCVFLLDACRCRMGAGGVEGVRCFVRETHAAVCRMRVRGDVWAYVVSERAPYRWLRAMAYYETAPIFQFQVHIE